MSNASDTRRWTPWVGLLLLLASCTVALVLLVFGPSQVRDVPTSASPLSRDGTRQTTPPGRTSGNVQDSTDEASIADHSLRLRVRLSASHARQSRQITIEIAEPGPNPEPRQWSKQPILPLYTVSIDATRGGNASQDLLLPLEGLAEIQVPEKGLLLLISSRGYVSQMAWLLPNDTGYTVTTSGERVRQTGWGSGAIGTLLSYVYWKSGTPAEEIAGAVLGDGETLALELGLAPILEFRAQTRDGDPVPLPRCGLVAKQPCTDGKEAHHSLQSLSGLERRLAARIAVPPDSWIQLSVQFGTDPASRDAFALEAPDDGVIPPLPKGTVFPVVLVAPQAKITHLVVTDGDGTLLPDAVVSRQGEVMTTRYDEECRSWPILIPVPSDGIRLCAMAPGYGSVIVPYKYGSQEDPYVVVLPQVFREIPVIVEWPNGYEPNGGERIHIEQRLYRDRSEWRRSETRLTLDCGFVAISPDGTCVIPMPEHGRVVATPEAEWLTFNPRSDSADREGGAAPLLFQSFGSAWLEITARMPDGQLVEGEQVILAAVPIASEDAAYPVGPGMGMYETLESPEWPVRMRAQAERYGISCATESGLVGTQSVRLDSFGIQPVEIVVRPVKPVEYQVFAPRELMPIANCTMLLSGGPAPLQYAGRFRTRASSGSRFADMAEEEIAEYPRRSFIATMARFQIGVDADSVTYLPDMPELTWHALIRGQGLFPTRLDHERHIVDVYVPDSFVFVEGVVNGLGGETGVQVAPVSVISPNQPTTISGSQFGVPVDEQGHFGVYLAPGRYEFYVGNTNNGEGAMRFSFGPRVEIEVTPGVPVPSVTLEANRD